MHTLHSYLESSCWCFCCHTGEVLAQCGLGCDEEVTALAAWPTLGMPFPLPGASCFLLPVAQIIACVGRLGGAGDGADNTTRHWLWLLDHWQTDSLPAVSLIQQVQHVTLLCTCDVRLWCGLGAHPGARAVGGAAARRRGPHRQGAHCHRGRRCRPSRGGQGSWVPQRCGGSGAVWRLGVAAPPPAGCDAAAAAGGGGSCIRRCGDVLHGAAAAAVARARRPSRPAAAAAAAAARRPDAQ
jgi:hypothetical protein